MNQKINACFIDFKKAFDKDKRDNLDEIPKAKHVDNRDMECEFGSQGGRLRSSSSVISAQCLRIVIAVF